MIACRDALAHYEATLPSTARHSFKIVLLGNSGAGKSSIVERLCSRHADAFAREHAPETAPTIGVEFATRRVAYVPPYARDGDEPETLILKIWDTAGQERFRSLSPSYIRDLNLGIVVFEVGDRKPERDALEAWIEAIELYHCAASDTRERAQRLPALLVIGNKIDLLQTGGNDAQRRDDIAKVLDRHARSFSSLVYMETSAHTGAGVRKMLSYIVERASCIVTESLRAAHEQTRAQARVFGAPPADAVRLGTSDAVRPDAHRGACAC